MFMNLQMGVMGNHNCKCQNVWLSDMCKRFSSIYHSVYNAYRLEPRVGICL